MNATDEINRILGVAAAPPPVPVPAPASAPDPIDTDDGEYDERDDDPGPYRKKPTRKRKGKPGRPRIRPVPDETERRPVGRPATGPSPEAVAKAEHFLRLKEAGVPRTEALTQAGYSPKNTNVEHKPAARLAAANLDRERMELQNTEGFRLKDIAKRFKKRATDEDVPASDQNNADKALVAMLDYQPAKKVDITAVGLLVELKDVPMSELLARREEALARAKDAEFEVVEDEDDTDDA